MCDNNYRAKKRVQSAEIADAVIRHAATKRDKHSRPGLHEGVTLVQIHTMRHPSAEAGTRQYRSNRALSFSTHLDAARP